MYSCVLCLDDDYLIVSGGDDNVFVVILVRINSEGVKVVIIGLCLCVYLIEIIGICIK